MTGLMAGLLLTAALRAQSDCAAPAHSSVRREAVNMPYMPGTGRTAPPRSVQFGNYVSGQVNVDASGNNILGDAANEPSIAVDPTNPDRMAIGWRQFDSVESDFRQAGHAYSTDAGRHWTFPGVLLPGIFGSDPVLASDGDGIFYFVSIDYSEMRLFKSHDQGQSWSTPTQMTPGFDDKEWITIDRTNGIGRGTIYCAWTGGGLRSQDGGASWSWLGDGGYLGTLAVGPNEELYLAKASYFRVDKSLNAYNPAYDPTFASHFVSLGAGIEYGLWPNPDGLMGQVWVDCDVSNGPTRGNGYLLCSVGDPTFVSFTRSVDGGQSWSSYQRINDDPIDNYAEHWFGTIAVAPNGRIDVIWNDTREFGDLSELYYSCSYDGGVTWTPNEQLSPAWDSSVGWPQQNKIGDYYHMISDNVGANLAYAATFNGEQDVWFLRIGDDLCQGLVAEQPASPTVCAGSAVSLHTSASPRGGTVTYQWRKDGANLSDTANILGTQATTLVFLHAQSSDDGYYECLLKLEGCGADMTNTAKLTVYPSGSADGNADGQVNGKDIAAFVSALVNHDSVSATTCAYDLTGDGIVSEADLTPFVARLLVSGF